LFYGILGQTNRIGSLPIAGTTMTVLIIGDIILTMKVKRARISRCASHAIGKDNTMTISFTGPEQVNTYTMLVIKSAMKFYLNSGGMKVNRAYTPTNMLRAAGGFTGKIYKRNQMPQAIADLENLLATN
jgi:hypothetical protein